jgi:hypothetical protein
MNTSEQTNDIIAALVACQEEMRAVKADTNPHFKSKYAKLDNILDTIKPHLKAHGLVVLQSIDTHDRKIECATTVFHTSGQWIESKAAVEADKGTPQGFGSAITYVRRYGIAAALGIGLMDDDDANDAEEQSAQAAVKKEAAIKLDKFKAAAIKSLTKYPADIIATAFEHLEGLQTEKEGAAAIAELVNQVDSCEKLTNIGTHIRKMFEQLPENQPKVMGDGLL